jgi:phage gpG-like protein
MPIEIQGLEEIQSSLNKLSQTLSPAQMKTTMNTIGNMVQNKIEESFEKEQSPWGEKWKPLKIVSFHLGYTIGKGKNTHTKKGKQTADFLRYTQNKKILRESGDLSDRWLAHADASSVTVASNVKSQKGYPYGAVHQWGSKRVHARRFFPVDESGRLESGLQKQIEDYLDKKIEQAIE